MNEAFILYIYIFVHFPSFARYKLIYATEKTVYPNLDAIHIVWTGGADVNLWFVLPLINWFLIYLINKSNILASSVEKFRSFRSGLRTGHLRFFFQLEGVKSKSIKKWISWIVAKKRDKLKSRKKNHIENWRDISKDEKNFHRIHFFFFSSVFCSVTHPT